MSPEPVSVTSPAGRSALQTKTTPITTRLLCLDALRGFDMFWIMGGDWVLRSLNKIHDDSFTRMLQRQMEHAANEEAVINAKAGPVDWTGFHFYDLIFPLFIFMAGMSIVFSVPKIIEQRGRGAAVQRIITRSVLLFFCGVLYMAWGWGGLWFAGVLQRIASAYLFAALLFCFFKPRALVRICVVCLVGYWALLRFVPMPGAEHASFEHGKNLAWWIDQHYLPGNKFEGTILSTIPAAANCLLGVFAALFITSNKIENRRKPMWLIGAGLLSLALGFAWAQFFPIVKMLWTSTYVLVACGYSAILLGIFYQVIELWQIRKWAMPFVWIGSNAITIYLVSAAFGFRKLANRFVGGEVTQFFNTHFSNSGEVLRSIVALILMLCVVRFLYQRKIFIRL
jgi:predicted acyltransferase